ncbi:MAG TPA: hypothetical protein VEI52_24820 [Terriglobales bacterium]|nr:hypothetical protein [Terriglobales bacterium]
MRVLCIFGMLCGLWNLAGALDREAFTFTKYDLEVRLEPEQHRLGVRGKITLRNDSSDSQKDLALQISSSLDWRSIKAGGKPLPFVTEEFNSDLDHTGAFSEAIVTVPEVPSKGVIELEVGYEGIIPLAATRLTRMDVPEEKAKHSDWDQISKSFTAVRGIGYVTWYPIATEDASFSDGNSVAETIGRWQAKEGNAEMEVKFESTSGAAIFFSTPGSPAEHSKGVRFSIVGFGITVPTFVMADYQKLAAKDSVAVYYLPGQQSAAEAYSEVAGQLDPLAPGGSGSGSLQILALPDADGQPFVTEGMLLTPLQSPLTNEAELSMVYAKGRQWLHSPRAWIEDGLAHFAQAEFIEKQKGRAAALDYLKAHATVLVEAEKQTSDKPGARDATHSLITAPNDLYLQTKAMYVWWMLRDMLGRLPVDALRGYRAAEDQEITYLERLIEKTSQRDLQWFFDDWVYHDRGLPDFRIDSVYSSPIPTGGFLVTVAVENSGSAGAEVPVTLEVDGTQISKRLEVRAKSKASIRIQVPSPPQQVRLNDGSVPESNPSEHVYTPKG